VRPAVARSSEGGRGFEPEPEPGFGMRSQRDAALFFGAVLAAVFVVGAYLWWTDLRFPRGPIEGLIPLSGGKAGLVVVTKEGDWLVLWDREAGWRRWSVKIGDFEPWTARAGATLSPDVITLRERKGGTLVTHGISVGGDELWTSGEGPWDETRRGPRFVTDLGGEALVFGVRETVPPTVIAMDRATGAERWRVQLPLEPVARAWTRGDALWVDQGTAIAVVEGGEVRTIEIAPGACVVGDTIWSQPAAGGTLRKGGADVATVTWSLAGLCGTFDGLVVAAATEGDHALVVGFDDGGERWRADLGVASWAIPGQDARLQQPEKVSFAGDLTRFLPALVTPSPGSDPAVAYVVMLDLAQRAVAWRSAADDSLAEYQLVHDAGRHFLYRRNVVASFDGATGELLAAKKLPGEGLILPYHFVDGVLWIYRDKAVVALDGGTLDSLPTVWGEMAIVEGKAEMAELLKPVP
jgi:hypothetical protein